MNARKKRERKAPELRNHKISQANRPSGYFIIAPLFHIVNQDARLPSCFCKATTPFGLEDLLFLEIEIRIS
jgi:hypothetical protein